MSEYTEQLSRKQIGSVKIGGNSFNVPNPNSAVRADRPNPDEELPTWSLQAGIPKGVEGEFGDLVHEPTNAKGTGVVGLSKDGRFKRIGYLSSENDIDEQKPNDTGVNTEAAPSDDDPSLLDTVTEYANQSIQEIPSAVIRGVYNAATEFNKFIGVDDAIAALADKLPDLDPDFITKSINSESETVPGALVEGATQFAVPFAAVNKGIKTFTALGQFARWGMSGFAADATGFNPDEGNSANFIKELFDLDDKQMEGVLPVVIDALSTDPDDPELINRVRNGLSGFVEGEALGLIAKTITSLPKFMKEIGNIDGTEMRNKLAQMAESSSLRLKQSGSTLNSGVPFDQIVDSLVVMTNDLVGWTGSVYNSGFRSKLNVEKKKLSETAGENQTAGKSANAWMNDFKSWTKQGVKQSEIDDSSIVDELSNPDSAFFPNKKKVTPSQIDRYLGINALKPVIVDDHSYAQYSVASEIDPDFLDISSDYSLAKGRAMDTGSEKDLAALDEVAGDFNSAKAPVFDLVFVDDRYKWNNLRKQRGQDKEFTIDKGIDHFQTPGSYMNMRISRFNTNTEQSVFMIEEIQSDLAKDLKKAGELAPDQVPKPHEVPYKNPNQYVPHAMKYALKAAAMADTDLVAFPTLQTVVDRYDASSAKMYNMIYGDNGIMKQNFKKLWKYLDLEGEPKFGKTNVKSHTGKAIDINTIELTPEAKQAIKGKKFELFAAAPIGLAVGGGISDLTGDDPNDSSFTGEEIQVAGPVGKMIRKLFTGPTPKPQRLASPLNNNYRPNIDYSAIKSPSDIDSLHRNLAGAYTPYQHGEKAQALKDISDYIGVPQQKLDAAFTRNPADVQAAHRMLKSSVKNLDGLAKDAVENPSVDAVGKWIKAFTVHKAMSEGFAGKGTQAQKTMDKLSTPSGGSPTAYYQGIINQNGGRDSIMYMVGLMQATNDPAVKSRFYKNSTLKAGKDAIYTTYVNALLSSPTTQAVNVLSNMSFMLASIPERAIAGMFPGGDISPGEGPALAIGYVHGLMDVMRLGAHWVNSKTGDPSAQAQFLKFRGDIGKMGFDDAYSKFEAGEKYNTISGSAFGQDGGVGTAIDYLGYALTFPGRLLQVTDASLKTMSYRGELYAQAVRESTAARKAGASDIEVENIFQSILNDPIPDAIHNESLEHGRMMTFTKDLGPGMKDLERGVDNLAGGVLRYVVPFIRTPTNVFTEGMKRTPPGALGNLFLKWKKGGAQRQEALAQTTLAFSLGGMFMYLNDAEVITSSNVTAKEKTKVQLQTRSTTGESPYSIKTPNGYISLDRFEPLSLPLKASVDTYQVLQNIDANDPEYQEVVSAFGSLMASYLIDSTWLQNVADFVDVINADGDEEFGRKMERFASQTVSGFAPNIMYGIESIGDPAIRVPDSTGDFAIWQETINRVKAKTPGISEDLPPLRGAFGEVIKRGTGSLTDLFNPLYYSEKGRGSIKVVGQELKDLGIYIDRPPRKIDGVELTAEQHDRFIEIRAFELGDPLKDILADYIESPAYQNIPSVELKAQMLKNITSKFTSAAKAQLIQEDPSIEAQIQQQRDIMYGAQ